MSERKNTQNPLVQVRCITFNHASYIEDAMDGFCMQETDFPFLCTVYDDASTDGEPEVIKNYLQKHCDIEAYEETEDYALTYATHQANRNCHFAVFLLKYNHYSIKKDRDQYAKHLVDETKYIALCEGDDYWTDPLKLQKQVDILENDKECMMCCSNGYTYSEVNKTTTIINPLPIDDSRFITPHEIFYKEDPLIPTCSMCYRKDMGDSMPSFFRSAPVGDRPIRMWCAINGKVYYHTEPMITYRSGAVGCYTHRIKQNNVYAQKIYNGMMVFFDKFDEYTDYSYHKDVEYMKHREAYVYYTNTANFKKILFAKHLMTYSFLKRTKIRFKCLIKLIPGVYRIYLKMKPSL